MSTVFVVSVIIAFFAFTLACIGTWLVRRYALKMSLMDIPNARSSHTQPVPRGGGLGIVVAVLMLCPTAYFCSVGWPIPLINAWFAAGALVAIVGLLDDRGGLPVGVRALCHFLAAALGLVLLGGVPAIYAAGIHLNTGVLDYILLTIFIIWFLNLFNFMDGIDGIAGVEAITACIGFIVILWVQGFEAKVMPFVILLAATLGFLVWNLPRARIFMGDAGSGFLGVCLALGIVYMAHLSAELFWAGLILLGVFIVDATTTLLRRVFYQEKFWQAHRTHAYQYAARYYNSHLKVTLAVGIINLVWLFPFALIITLNLYDGFVLLLVAYTPLVFLALFFQAGKSEAIKPKETQENI